MRVMTREQERLKDQPIDPERFLVLVIVAVNEESWVVEAQNAQVHHILMLHPLAS